MSMQDAVEWGQRYMTQAEWEGVDDREEGGTETNAQVGVQGHAQAAGSEGRRFLRQHPDWPHECCSVDGCHYRERDLLGRMTCHAPNECDYFIPQNAEAQTRRVAT